MLHVTCLPVFSWLSVSIRGRCGISPSRGDRNTILVPMYETDLSMSRNSTNMLFVLLFISFTTSAECVIVRVVEDMFCYIDMVSETVTRERSIFQMVKSLSSTPNMSVASEVLALAVLHPRCTIFTVQVWEERCRDYLRKASEHATMF